MAEAQYQELKALGGDDYEAMIIIMEDSSFSLPSESYCKQLRTQYGLTMPVLMDDGTLTSTLGISPKNHWNIVTTEGAEVVYKKKGSNTDSVAKTKLEELLQ